MTKKVEHYFSEEQTSAFRPKLMRVKALGNEFEIYTAGGVFSPKRLDKGTELLIERSVIRPGSRVLDLGCGYGVVGIAIKKKFPSVDVVMSDVNLRAVKLARMNVKLHRLDIKVVQSDGFRGEELDGMEFDNILLNPPQTAGKDVCFRLIGEAYAHLSDIGVLHLVARHQKGGRTLSSRMAEVFGNVSELAKGSGFRVYASEKE